MRIDHKSYMGALMFLRAHFKKHDVPIPGEIFKNKFGFLVGQLETIGIIKVIPKCYKREDQKFSTNANGKVTLVPFSKYECGVQLTLKGYWTIYHRIGID